MRDGLLFYQDKLFIPNDENLKQAILIYFHSTPVGGHGGLTKTVQGIADLFYWADLKSEAQEFIQKCLVCQQTKFSTAKPMGLLQPLPIPQAPWQEISMDFIKSLPSSHSLPAILVVVDRYTKGAHFIGLRPNFTAKVVADVFMANIVKLHGYPKHIVTDRDPIFFSLFWKGVMKHSGMQLHYNTAYHPQTDGQTEVVNRCLEQYLRAFCSEEPSRWSKFLAMAELWYNSSYHSSTKMSPYKALYGMNPPTLPGYTSGTSSVESVDACYQLGKSFKPNFGLIWRKHSGE